VLDPLFTIVRASYPKADLTRIERAYRTAEHYHHGQTRKNGDPYITHPLAVATILAELGMAEDTICAGLLHDTVEDTAYTLEQLRVDFGDRVARRVDGVTKLDKLSYGDTAKAETIRKLILHMDKDLQILVIKLADRLHNMRTLAFLRSDKQIRIAKETLDIFAPLADRLGMAAIKWEMEDLAFATVQPKLYDEIVRLVTETAPERDRQLKEVIDATQAELAAQGLNPVIYGRPKHYYSIYQKMVVRGREFQDIYDLVGIRVICATESECWAALGVIQKRWMPLPNRYKNYISHSKENGYQSIHTTVIVPGGRPVEFQIRTQQMHQVAELGVAAHFRYKHGKNVESEEEELLWMHGLAEMAREMSDPQEYIEEATYALQQASKKIFIITPAGEALELPEGSTPVDMAYAVHTQVGNRCIGARVNGRMVPLSTRLVNADRVEILTTKNEDAGPSRDWLGFVISPRARAKIRAYFSRERRDEAIEHGKDVLAKQLRRTGLPIQKLLTIENLNELAMALKYQDAAALYAAIGEGALNPPGVVQRLVTIAGGPETLPPPTAESRSPVRSRQRSNDEVGVIVDGGVGMMVRLAKCCTPMPGDEILGFVTRESGVSLHRADCTNANDLRSHPERLVEVQWASDAHSFYEVAVLIEALDQPGLIADVTRVLSEQRVNITALTVTTKKDSVARIKMTFEVEESQHLNHLFSAIRALPGIYDAYRIKA
jgi:GTP pyrophosphokinase